ncbi:MAG TPA: metal-dependent hydrolase [Chitinophagaceae bacterium]
MFIAHFGAGMAAKKAAPGVSLGLLVIASQFLDLLWPILLLTGVETMEIRPGIVASNPLAFTHYPWSHSLLMVLAWSFLAGIIYWLFTKKKAAALVIGLCVLSHWVLDLVVHIPDLPLAPGKRVVWGLGLWNNPAASMIAELLIFSGGVYLYLSNTHARNRKGVLLFWVFTGLLLITQLLNAFSPRPPDVRSVAWAGNLQWLFVLLAFLTDHNRAAVLSDRRKITLAS